MEYRKVLNTLFTRKALGYVSSLRCRHLFFVDFPFPVSTCAFFRNSEIGHVYHVHSLHPPFFHSRAWLWPAIVCIYAHLDTGITNTELCENYMPDRGAYIERSHGL